MLKPHLYNATPLLAEIEGVRGTYFSKRLHHTVVRFVTDDAADRYALEQILQERYAVSINVPDYSELTRHTTGEHAGRFSEFKNEELMALVSILEEFPSGMIKTPGLNYLVRRLDGTPHPLYPGAPAVAWPSAGYIEFMESAFKGTGVDYISPPDSPREGAFFSGSISSTSNSNRIGLNSAVGLKTPTIKIVGQQQSK